MWHSLVNRVQNTGPRVLRACEHALILPHGSVFMKTAVGVPEASFDVATCRHGLMYMPEPVAALRTLHKALNQQVGSLSVPGDLRNAALSLVLLCRS